MKKNDVFTFTAPNGAKVLAVVVNELTSDYREMTDTIITVFLCYAQNRLFTYFEECGRRNAFTPDEETYIIKTWYGKVLVDYCIIPEYDKILEDYSHQLDMADDYADKTL